MESDPESKSLKKKGREIYKNPYMGFPYRERKNVGTELIFIKDCEPEYESEYMEIFLKYWGVKN